MKSYRKAEYDLELKREYQGGGDSSRVGRVRVRNRTILWCDAAFAQMFGYSPHELIGQPTRLLHPSDQVYRQFGEAAFPAISRGEIFRTEAQQRRKDGTLGWYDISVGSASPDSDEQNGAFIDITDRRRAWLAVLKAEEHYRSLFAAMSEGVVVHARNGEIIEANPAAERILQLTRDQILGRTPLHPQWEAIHEDGRPFLSEDHPALVTLRTGRALLQQIMGVRSRSAELRWISVNSEPVFEAGGDEPRAAIATFVDITDQRRLASDLRQARSRLHAILDHVPAMIGYWNLELRCEFANRAYLDWFGMLPERVIGMHMSELLGAAFFKLHEVRARQALRGVPQHFERALRKPDGSTGHVDARYIPDIDASGGVRGFFVMASDITALHESTERAHELTRRLEIIRDEERRSVAQSLHEGIAQELFAAKLTLDLLRARAGSGEQQALWEELSGIIVACSRSTRELANAVRPAALAHLDIADAIRQHARHVQELSGLRISVSVNAFMPHLHAGVRSALFRTTQEALTNAIRHAKATTVSITLGATENTITLEILDDGCGIKEDDLSKAASLGLRGIRERVEALGGGLSIDRSANGGTRLSAHVPKHHDVSFLQHRP